VTRAELIQFINANIYPNGRNQITAPMVRDSILAVVGFLGDAAVKDIGAVLENNTDLVTGGAVYDAIRAYLSSVMKMVGETTTDVITNPTANPVYVDGEPHSAQKGDVVVYGYKEFWWTGSQWKELGDEASWALKTITITGTGDITGGGSLEANRTLDLTQNAKDKLAHGETAFSWLESYSTNRLRLKSPYAYLNARKGLILEEETDYTNTPADFVKQVITIGETEYTILRSKLPIVSDSFISAGGVSPGGGASGTTLDAVWGSLTTNTDDFANDKIHSGHIPLGSGLGVDGSGNIYVTSQGTVTGIKIGSTTYTPSAGSTIVDISSGIPTSMAWSAITSTPTTLAGYGITDAKIESGVITLGSNTITPLTSHQTLYNLVINNSAGTAQITYQPGVSGTYALTLTKAMVGLSNVENTALSTWAGTSNITTLGTISTGVWQGTAIGYNYVAAHYIGRTRTTASAAQATLLGIDAISNASSSGSSDTSRIVWDSTNNAWHFLGGIYADSFISAGGLSSGGGTSGIDLAAMWASLQNTDNADTSSTAKLAITHLPALTANNGLTASYGSTSSGSGLADTLTIGVGSSYKLPLVTEWNAKADASALNDYVAKQTAGAQTIYASSSDTGLFLRSGVDNAWLGFKNASDNYLGWFGYYSGHPAAYDNQSGSLQPYKLWHEGNFTPSDYLPLAGGTIISTTFGALEIKRNSANSSSGIKFSDSSYVAGYLGMQYAGTAGSYVPCYWDASTNAYQLYHTGNLSPITTTNWSSYIGTSTAYVGYATNATYATYDSASNQISTYYLPLSAGSGKALTGDLYFGGNSIRDVAKIYPSYTLNVVAGAINDVMTIESSGAYTLLIFKNNGNQKGWIGYTAYNAIGMAAVAADDFNLDMTTGYLGLGKHNPGTRLDINGTITATGGVYNLTGINDFAVNIGSGTSSSAIKFTSSTTNLGYIGVQYNANDYRPGYWDASTNFYRFWHSGNSNISTATWTCSTLSSYDSINVYSAACLYHWSANGTAFYTYFGHDARLSGSWWYNGQSGKSIRLYDAGGCTIDDYLTVNYNIVATGAITAGSASSVEFKDNVQNMSLEYARNIIMSSRPITFQWNALAHSLYDKYEGDGIGFIAQEAEQLMPFAVSPIFEKYKRLDYTAYVSPLVRMSQYLLTTTDNHETRIQQLENRVRELENENNQLRQRLN